MYIRSGQSPKVPYHESGRQEAALRIEQQQSVRVIWEGKEKWGYRGTNKNRKPFPFEIPPGWSNLKGGGSQHSWYHWDSYQPFCPPKRTPTDTHVYKHRLFIAIRPPGTCSNHIWGWSWKSDNFAQVLLSISPGRIITEPFQPFILLVKGIWHGTPVEGLQLSWIQSVCSNNLLTSFGFYPSCFTSPLPPCASMDSLSNYWHRHPCLRLWSLGKSN